MAVPPAKTGKAAPFRRRVEDSLDAARAKGFAEVTITTADGAEYRFKSDRRCRRACRGQGRRSDRGEASPVESP